MVFHVIFLNRDISIIVADIILKFCMVVLHIPPEGSVSQIFLFRPQFLFYAILKKKFQKMNKIYPFFDIK